MLVLSKEFRLAMEILKKLDTKTPTAPSELVEPCKTTMPFIRKIISKLGRANLVESLGHKGVIRLEKPCNLLKLFTAIHPDYAPEDELDKWLEMQLFIYKI
jgi:DNA-binding IscR family transcriptional regulator